LSLAGRNRSRAALLLCRPRRDGRSRPRVGHVTVTRRCKHTYAVVRAPRKHTYTRAAVVMATTIGLRDPLWRDPGLDLVKFLSTGGARDPATGVERPFSAGRRNCAFQKRRRSGDAIHGSRLQRNVSKSNTDLVTAKN